METATAPQIPPPETNKEKRPESEVADNIEAISEVVFSQMIKNLPAFIRAMNAAKNENLAAIHENKRMEIADEQAEKMSALECFLANEKTIRDSVDLYYKLVNADDDEDDDDPTVSRKQAVEYILKRL